MAHLKSAIFDMDGVVTNTAELHFESWKNIFDSFLKEFSKKNGAAFKEFSKEDYLYYVDGIPRIEGIKSFFSSRNIHVQENIYGKLGDKKNRFFINLIKKQNVNIFPSTINFIKKLKKHKIKIAIISSSKNCKYLIKSAGIEHLFNICIDGNTLESKHIPGKPMPDIFLEAAKALDTDPTDAMIIEDAILGVRAGHAGNFSLVIGVDRNNLGKTIFEENGADIVVNDLSELSIKGVFHWFYYKIQPVFKKNGSINSDLKLQLLNKNLAFFIDFDGTLTPIVNAPNLAVLKKQTFKILKQLSRSYPIAILSGRELSDLKEKIKLDNIYYIGNHGFQIEGPLVKNTVGEKYINPIKKSYIYLTKEIGSISGIIIENKKFTLSIHYRLVDESNMGKIHKAINTILRNNHQLIRREGKKIFEIRPNIDWNKGSALLWLLSHLKPSYSNIFPIAIGDDKTDEDAFLAIKNYGVGILVTCKKTPTAASYCLKNTDEVEKFLGIISNEFEK